MEKLIEVKLVGLVLEPISKTPVIILKPLNDNKIIPIWIGEYEANAITMELENISPPRPMTHDLINDILASLNSKVEKVVITDIVDNTYYADLYIRRGGELSVVDCRPSDAISVALKNRAKIYVSELVYRSSVLSDFISHFAHSEERLEQWFDSLSSEDFGNVEQ
ncbi:MAG: bifunctional nuclease family protein [Candidatus Aminicenantes bacterium]|nr:bifunctional nuclease family protein [Candidatus Aminicenantes bacterium]NIM84697.1 bifunctional nuclease family protein [Candidatus Aminicenantes bacterium]NIN24196.1 bifunctional nuclease family protein [Candidatus Aminicenantes bacterium]NIN47921.1 bifunctional nuclease family protein [Candidatus Aminicenantes bacterium]NIN90859.1 bifunctional nuclease family protein [Candidatus Aminicenantes bacterium]